MIYYKLTLKHGLTLAVLGFAILMASIQPLEFSAYLLHQLGTVLMLMVLLYCQNKIGLSYLSFLGYILFLIIHVIGAHYLYSYVPYNDWIKSVFAFDLNQTMGWSRNMYDRWVHFIYGLFLYPFFYRLWQVWLPNVPAKILFMLVIQFVMASSLIYEWIEWWIAIALSPEQAENYNGQQGDIWDAHQDMLLATLGSLLAGLIQIVNPPKSNRSD